MTVRIKNISLLTFFMVASVLVHAQVVQQKVGDHPTMIEPNAVLELESTNKGLLLPRVELVATDNVAPLTAHIQGMTVYNKATAGSGATAVTPGYYYNDGSKWIRIGSGGEGGGSWNDVATGTTATSYTQNIYQMGKVGIGIENPVYGLDVIGGVNKDKGTMRIERTGPNTGGSYVALSKRNTGNTAVGTGDILGAIRADAYVGDSTYESPARIVFKTTTDAAAPTGTVPTDIQFATGLQGSEPSFQNDNGVKMTIKNNGNVGIGTLDPKVTLDVTGKTGTANALKADGLLIPRFTVAELAAKDNAYGANQEGTLVYIKSGTGSGNGKTSGITGVGFYYYDSTAQKWVSVTRVPAPTPVWEMGEYYDYTATARTTLKVANTNGELLPGFEQAITIPAGKQAKVVVSYSIPVGKTGMTATGYYGITLQKKVGTGTYTDYDAGSRKYTQIAAHATDQTGMTTVGATVSDVYASASTARTVSYRLLPYIEAGDGIRDIYFNMYKATAASTDPNFNWGYGYWSITVYYK